MIVSGPKPRTGFVVLNRHRRLVRQYKTTPTAHEGFLVLGQLRLTLKRLDKGRLFDRL
ncbi:hypothetical protein [Arthrobacter sp. efr-133-R2A-63]|uniref:hypothetical protein n=1 Tax=Arthrobacter sp. efr-133-R2A-63 TaxID=3040278 RepID=UPI00254A047E|nr:hypothetical protein [Arthrobacter sp. efr-133-R2A-63]